MEQLDTHNYKQILSDFQLHTNSKNIPPQFIKLLSKTSGDLSKSLEQPPHDPALESQVLAGILTDPKTNLSYKLDPDSTEYVKEFSSFVNLNQVKVCSLLNDAISNSITNNKTQYKSIEDLYFSRRETPLLIILHLFNSLPSFSSLNIVLEKLITNDFISYLENQIKSSFQKSLKFSDHFNFSGSYNNEFTLLSSIYLHSIKYSNNNSLNSLIKILDFVYKEQNEHFTKYKLEEGLEGGIINLGIISLIMSFIHIASLNISNSKEITKNINSLSNPIKSFISILVITEDSQNNKSFIDNIINLIKKENFFKVIYNQLTYVQVHYQYITDFLIKLKNSIEILLDNQLVLNTIINDNQNYSKYFFQILHLLDYPLSPNLTNFFASNLSLPSPALPFFLDLLLNKSKTSVKISCTQVLEETNTLNKNLVIATLIEALKVFKTEIPNKEESETFLSVLKLTLLFPSLLKEEAELPRIVITFLSYNGLSSVIRSHLLLILTKMVKTSNEKSTQIWGYINQLLEMVILDFTEVQLKEKDFCLTSAFFGLLVNISKGRNLTSLLDVLLKFINYVLKEKLVSEVFDFLSQDFFLILVRNENIIDNNQIQELISLLFRNYLKELDRINDIERKTKESSEIRTKNKEILKINKLQILENLDKISKALYSVLVNNTQTLTNLKYVTTSNLDGVESLLVSFPYYSLKIIGLLFEHFPISVFNYLTVKLSTPRLYEKLLALVNREEGLLIITKIFKLFSKAKGFSDEIIHRFIDLFTSKKFLVTLLNPTNSSKSESNLKLKTLRAILKIGCCKESIQLLIDKLVMPFSLNKGKRGELTVSESLFSEQNILSDDNCLEMKLLSLKCLILVINRDHKINYGEIIESYLISFLKNKTEKDSLKHLVKFSEKVSVLLTNTHQILNNNEEPTDLTSKFISLININKTNKSELLLTSNLAKILSSTTKFNCFIDKQSLFNQFLSLTNSHQNLGHHFHLPHLIDYNSPIQVSPPKLLSSNIFSTITDSLNQLLTKIHFSTSNSISIIDSNSLIQLLESLTKLIFIFNHNQNNSEKDFLRLRKIFFQIFFDLLIEVPLKLTNSSKQIIENLIEQIKILFINISSTYLNITNYKNSYKEDLEIIFERNNIFNLIKLVTNKDNFCITILLLNSFLYLPIDYQTITDTYHFITHKFPDLYINQIVNSYKIIKNNNSVSINDNKENIKIGLSLFKLNITKLILEGKERITDEDLFCLLENRRERKEIESENHNIENFMESVKELRKDNKENIEVGEFVEFVEFVEGLKGN